MLRITHVGLFVLAGCGGTHRTPDEPRTNETVSAICTDDKTGCNDPNGTGVYTAENGEAKIGADQLMITHFINESDRVTFQGRYFDPQKGWSPLPSPGSIVSASMPGKPSLRVVAVSEASTELRWQLRDLQTQATLVVPSPNTPLTELTINVQFTLPYPRTLSGPRPPLPAPGALPADGTPPGNLRSFALSVRPVAAPGGASPAAKTYELSWRDLADTSGKPAQPYCLDAQKQPDPVVFQRAIDVDPVTGKVQRNQDADRFVTMSCWRGALATVYGWGYDYGKGSATAAADSFHFDAAIQMKRASYCGDAQHFTVAGTDIYIVDNKHIQPQTVRPGKDKDIEALWTPEGASCVNLAKLRHVGLGFKGECPDKKLAPCFPLPENPNTPFLADAPEYPGAP